MDCQYSEIAKMIDHALLTPSMATDSLADGCRLALAYDVASVCILPYAVKLCAEILNGSSVKVSTVIGFPHGSNRAEIKRGEAEMALADGCEELDMVVNISKVVSGDWDFVRNDICGVVDVAHAAGQKVKVIFENHYLSAEQIKTLCSICGEVGADWVKTSTGFASTGAVLNDVRLMRESSPDHVQVKAAGGIRDLDTLLAFRVVGATRIGASSTATILDECRNRLDLPAITASAPNPAGY